MTLMATRRTLSGLAAGTLVLALIPWSPATAVASTATPIEHLVVIYQENASFDHYFGTYPVATNPPGSPTFTARDDTPPVNNLLPTPLNGNRDLIGSNPNSSPPHRLDHTQFETCSQSHAYGNEQTAAHGGLMDRFVESTDRSNCALPVPVDAPQVMGYYDGNTVTALWNYAQHFALSDNTYGTTYGPSTPGALNLVAGRTSEASAYVQHQPTTNIAGVVSSSTVFGDPDPFYDDCFTNRNEASLSGPNIGNLLNGSGVTWGWFQGGFARTNPLSEATAKCASKTRNLSGSDADDYEAHHDPFQYFASTANPHHLPATGVIGTTDQANHQYDLTDFWTAVDNGQLPAVSFLKAPGYQDGHPGPGNSDPLDEQQFLVQTLDRLQQSSQWSHTAVVIAWDDSDGWYDHAFPPNVHHSNQSPNDTLY
ncbi:MAG: phospholipase, partial [Actinomycetota bacterium]|nr:phospholipase [Actinomycetota bacterium]